MFLLYRDEFLVSGQNKVGFRIQHKISHLVDQHFEFLLNIFYLEKIKKSLFLVFNNKKLLLLIKYQK